VQGTGRARSSCWCRQGRQQRNPSETLFVHVCRVDKITSESPRSFCRYHRRDRSHGTPRAQHPRAHLHHGQGISPSFDCDQVGPRPPQQPDGVDRGLVGEILTRFEKRGFKLIASKLALPSKTHLEDRPCLPVLPDALTLTSHPQTMPISREEPSFPA
jgi:hypothetical protein